MIGIFPLPILELLMKGTGQEPCSVRKKVDFQDYEGQLNLDRSVPKALPLF